MITSEKIDAIMPALVKFHQDFKGVNDDKVVQGKFSYGYKTLDSIFAAVKPLLTKNDLILVHDIGSMQDGFTAIIETTIFHSSGQFIKSDKPLYVKPLKLDPQGLGGAITYGKRYQLSALLNVCDMADDDGKYASTPGAPPHTPQLAPINQGQFQLINSFVTSGKITKEEVFAISLAKFNKEQPGTLLEKEADILIADIKTKIGIL